MDLPTREWIEQFVRIHRDWTRAGKVPRFPDENAIENIRKTVFTHELNISEFELFDKYA